MDKDLYNILNMYSFTLPLSIKQVDNKSVWQINDSYILKKNGEKKDIEKVLMINKFLKEESIPVVEYIKTISGEYYIELNGSTYSLMYKMIGEHIEYANPFVGDYKNTAYHTGIEIARLHKALKKLGNNVVYESDLIEELKTQLIDIKANNIGLPDEIINLCLAFSSDYHLLLKQVIHRDVQFGNMLFENERLTCFLDFDSSQVNVRLFDIVYFGQSILFTNNYRDSEFVIRWVEFFNFLLSGYRVENILYENEIKSIYKMFVLLQIGFISFYLHIKEKKKLIPKRIDMVKWIYSNEPLFTFTH